MNDALGDVPLFHDEPIPPQSEEAYKAALKHQRKLGLPDPKDPGGWPLSRASKSHAGCP
jgi:hypothetical protein